MLEGPRTPSGPERALCGGGVRSCHGRGHGARGNGGSWSAVSRRVVLLACLACVPRSTRAPSSKEHHPGNCAVRARGFALALRCHSRTRESRAERYIALTLLTRDLHAQGARVAGITGLMCDALEGNGLLGRRRGRRHTLQRAKTKTTPVPLTLNVYSPRPLDVWQTCLYLTLEPSSARLRYNLHRQLPSKAAAPTNMLYICIPFKPNRKAAAFFFPFEACVFNVKSERLTSRL